MNNVGDVMDALPRPSRETKTEGSVSSAAPNLRAYDLVPNSLSGEQSKSQVISLEEQHVTRTDSPNKRGQ
jgi:hypothetical protein